MFSHCSHLSSAWSFFVELNLFQKVNKMLIISCLREISYFPYTQELIYIYLNYTWKMGGWGGKSDISWPYFATKVGHKAAIVVCREIMTKNTTRWGNLLSNKRWNINWEALKICCSCQAKKDKIPIKRDCWSGEIGHGRGNLSSRKQRYLWVKTNSHWVNENGWWVNNFIHWVVVDRLPEK